MKARIYFWYKGIIDWQSAKNVTLDTDLDLDGTETEAEKMRAAEDALESRVIKGMIDHLCDGGISNFGVEKLELNQRHRTKARFKE